MPVEVTGIPSLVTELRQLGKRVPATARKIFHRGADKIIKEAKLNTPVDTEGLEESLRKEVTYGYRGRLQIDLVAGGTVNSKGVNTSVYAVEIHENYEDPERGGPGKKTLAKMAANPGRIIGSGFLRRALEAEREKLARQLIEAVEREIQNAL